MSATIVIDKETLQEELKSVFLKRASIKKSELSSKMVLHEILDENIFKLGHILKDLHEVFEVEPTYAPLSEFDTFNRVQDVEEYFSHLLLNKK